MPPLKHALQHAMERSPGPAGRLVMGSEFAASNADDLRNRHSEKALRALGRSPSAQSAAAERRGGMRGRHDGIIDRDHSRSQLLRELFAGINVASENRRAETVLALQIHAQCIAGCIEW